MKSKKRIALPLSKIKPNVKNPRKGTYDRRDIEELKESFESLGQITPIKVVKEKGDFYTILSGHRRFVTAKELNWETLDADIYEQLSPMQKSSIMFTDNTTHKIFKAWDMRESINDIYWNEFCEEYTFKSQLDRGYGEFSKLIGISTSWVRRIIESMSKENQVIINRVKKAELGASTVDEIVSAPKKHRESLTNAVIKRYENKDKKANITMQRPVDFIRSMKTRLSMKQYKDNLPVSFLSRIKSNILSIVDNLPDDIIKKLTFEQKEIVRKQLKKIIYIENKLK